MLSLNSSRVRKADKGKLFRQSLYTKKEDSSCNIKFPEMAISSPEEEDSALLALQVANYEEAKAVIKKKQSKKDKRNGNY